ncbi:glycosyl transferase family protein [Mycobacterium numidiamassiliense]|uniref:Glycosyl transferase family protein n=1 Tax=Mycobacterium numidiamassiliense TaxID=1841861 RepID=A0A2U3PH48_9MYCO|nr:glycosyltransferase [Mycobacterium numidiamassiliense]SPM43097.1 glycosyl transferase family protein [Mycobacterium numidiamassiliense]
MKFALASYGTRGDIEPTVAVGRELLRRGHEVSLAVPPDLVGFVESVGLGAVPYGPDTQVWLDTYRTFWTSFFGSFWRIPYLIKLWGEIWETVIRCWEEMTTALTSLADGADLLLTGQSFMETAANVAEYFDIPLATLHYVPVRANGHLLPILPPPVGRSVMTVMEWAGWRMNKKAEDTQRRELGLPKATSPALRRITERGSLEIQGYDELCFPGLADEWAKWDGLRPFVGTLTMELTTDADDEVASWIAAGKPPICFGFGSMPVESPLETLEMISSACARLGERALICAGWSDFGDAALADHVKIVRAVSYAATFPVCRAVVHHGGAGTTAASLRAGVPTLILSMDLVQTIWGTRIKHLKVGTTRRFSATTTDSLVSDLRQILAPEYAVRAREVATHMTKPAESVANTADLMEDFARLKHSG